MSVIKSPSYPILSLGLLACLAIMGLILWLGPYSLGIQFLPDSGFEWYYWKLPEPTFITRLTAWSGYALHQVFLWGLIWYARKTRPIYAPGLHPINIVALAGNAFFVLLHIAQTRWTYDGLAQDTSVMSSQASVVFMLVFILIMENRRRGLFFGKKVGFVDAMGDFLRQYHGYYFSWAIIYTFWFHPIETTLGHLMGTFYILMLLLQGSLFFTRSHLRRGWTTLLEVFVLLHGVVVAYIAVQQDAAGMFFFGFLFLFVVTQMHGLRWHKSVRWIITLLSIAAVFIVYWAQPKDAIEVLRIPLAEYGFVIFIAGVYYLVTRFLNGSAQDKSALQETTEVL
ncbi:MAG: hypothetical protein V7711_17095 [Pseudomonadales bacterium]